MQKNKYHTAFTTLFLLFSSTVPSLVWSCYQTLAFSAGGIDKMSSNLKLSSKIQKMYSILEDIFNVEDISADT